MTRHRLFGLLAALLCPFFAIAAPPYDVEVTVTAPMTGGAVDSYVLYLDGVSQGPVAEGLNTFPGLLTADGTYTFEVGAINAAGEVRSDPVTVTVTEILLPGKPTIQIQVSCDPCVVTVN